MIIFLVFQNREDSSKVNVDQNVLTEINHQKILKINTDLIFFSCIPFVSYTFQKLWFETRTRYRY